jgi:hypothetical protein
MRFEVESAEDYPKEEFCAQGRSQTIVVMHRDVHDRRNRRNLILHLSALNSAARSILLLFILESVEVNQNKCFHV